MKRKTFLLVLLMLLILLPACANKSGLEGADIVEYLITQNYGEKILLDKKIAYRENASIMDGLIETGADVKTSYGGSFISGINGLNTDNGGPVKERSDWFYYVNGIFSDCGALDYMPQPGEVIWWDYHPWKSSKSTTAVIGCFPEPFLHGFRGNVAETTILTVSKEVYNVAKLQQTMQSYGVNAVNIKKITAELLENRDGPTMAVGEWNELKEYKWINDFNEAYQKNGTFLHFTEEGLELLDYKGAVAREIKGSAGVIMAIGEGNGDDSPLWIIAGTDSSGMAAALDVLINNPEKIRTTYSVVVLSEEIIKLPLTR